MAIWKGRGHSIRHKLLSYSCWSHPLLHFPSRNSGSVAPDFISTINSCPCPCLSINVFFPFLFWIPFSLPYELTKNFQHVFKWQIPIKYPESIKDTMFIIVNIEKALETFYWSLTTYKCDSWTIYLAMLWSYHFWENLTSWDISELSSNLEYIFFSYTLFKIQLKTHFFSCRIFLDSFRRKSSSSYKPFNICCLIVSHMLIEPLNILHCHLKLHHFW